MSETVGMSKAVWAERGDAEAVADHVASVIAQPGAKTLAVPGGRTPVPILEALAARALDWTGAEIWPTDDRVVPAEHPASNFGMLQRTLGGTGATLRPLGTDTQPPRFNLVWLGMGEDGHVASIFPSIRDAIPLAPAVVEVTPDPLPPEAPFARLTLTLGALADCEAMILVIAGPGKRAVIEDALAGRSDLPIARLLRILSAPPTIYWTL